jgi:O-antigen/teichoic acid export membrane protein
VAGQLRPIVLIKIAQVVSMVLFTVAAPRLLGPTRFGQLAVILSMSALWQTACTLGGRYVFGRFIPEYAARGDQQRVRAVFMHVLETRVAAAALAAPFLYLLLRRSLPGASNLALAASTGGFLVLSFATPLYNVFFGLNRLGTSMSRDAFTQFVLLGLLVATDAASSLERAALAVLLTQLAAFVVGVALCRRLFTFDRSMLDLRALYHHARFGLTVFGANLLLRLPWRLGETALALARIPAAQIGFFNVALSAAAAFTRILGGATTLQIPELSLREAAGDGAGRDRGLGVALRYLTIASVLFVLVVMAAAPFAVERLLGKEYLGVLPNLSIVTLAVLAAPMIRTGLARAVVEIRLVRTATLGLVALATFALAAVLLIPTQGARGASIALVAANFAAAAVSLFQIRSGSVLRAARLPRQLLAAALPAAILLAAGPSPLAAAIAAVVYGGGVFALRIVEWGDLRKIMWAVVLGS